MEIKGVYSFIKKSADGRKGFQAQLYCPYVLITKKDISIDCNLWCFRIANLKDSYKDRDINIGFTILGFGIGFQFWKLNKEWHDKQK